MTTQIEQDESFDVALSCLRAALNSHYKEYRGLGYPPLRILRAQLAALRDEANRLDVMLEAHEFARSKEQDDDTYVPGSSGSCT